MLSAFNNNGFPVAVWHIRDDKPTIDSSAIDYIKADNQEMDYLRLLFPTFPFPNLPSSSPVVVPGEMARYIWLNL